jgi:hypothetical protein
MSRRDQISRDIDCRTDPGLVRQHKYAVLILDCLVGQPCLQPQPETLTEKNLLDRHVISPFGPRMGTVFNQPAEMPCGFKDEPFF